MNDRETLEKLKTWIMSCGTEEDGKYEPPSAKDAVEAIDSVLDRLEVVEDVPGDEENERLRAEVKMLRAVTPCPHKPRIDAALALHYRAAGGNWCEVCVEDYETGRHEDWPCPTYEALKGEGLRADLEWQGAVIKEYQALSDERRDRIDAALAIAVSLAVSHPHIGRPLLAALKGKEESECFMIISMDGREGCGLHDRAWPCEAHKGEDV